MRLIFNLTLLFITITLYAQKKHTVLVAVEIPCVEIPDDSKNDVLGIPLHSMSQVFPNPTTGLIQLPELLPNTVVKVLDFSGRQLELFSDLKSQHINISELPQGLYFLLFHSLSTNQSSMIKIQKK